jgi:mono/diheme cytochrome c family protein
MAAAVGALLFLLVGPAAAAPADLVARGRALVEEAQCGRCHTLPDGVPPTPRARSCAGCHAWIHASREDAAQAARARRDFPLWDRYMASVASFLAVPDLRASAARLDPAFIAAYLRAPFKVRPSLAEGMIRTGLSAEEAAAVAAWLTAAPVTWSSQAAAAAAIPLSITPADLATGGQIFDRLRCASCHAIDGRAPLTTALPAPDLAFVRARMRPATVAAFLVDPTIGGTRATAMPSYALSAAEAARLRDYLFARPARPSVVDQPAELPLLARPVSYAEVRAQVLDRICIHCHMDARRNGGEGGPGNTGGLGYAGAGLDLETWAGIQRGARDARGRRVSILTGPAGTEPPLVARLRARYAEHARELAGPDFVTSGGAPGMPLGLPPLGPEQFQLVRSWVAQGAPGPVTRDSTRRARAFKVTRRTAEGPRQ